MKVETYVFAGICAFFIVVAAGYGIVTDWSEWVGILGLALVAGLAGMIAFYLYVTGRRVGLRPEDRPDAEIHEGSGEQGLFSPWSWWPIMLAAAAAVGFFGLAVGFWMVIFGIGLAAIGLVGWVFEYSRGDHAH